MTTITAKTTEEAIMRNVVFALGNLADEAADAQENPSRLGGEALVRAAQEVRNAQALATAQLRYLNLLLRLAEIAKSGEPHPLAIQYRMDLLFTTISSGADDTWSGRMNDSSRAAYDVVRDWACSEMNSVRYEAENQ